MSFPLVLGVLILAIALLFLIISILMIFRKYTIKGAILAVFFLIMSIKYLFFIYYEIEGIPINIYVIILPDFVIILSLLVLTITR